MVRTDMFCGYNAKIDAPSHYGLLAYVMTHESISTTLALLVKRTNYCNHR